ncbi:MAG: hypothetical protein GXP62_07535, partial [Oligoflexia bacterium]|nr:hypothetical protein [Oligoflexia bacterium]
MTTSHPESGDGHLNTLLLHQLRYGELDATATRAARTHLDACSACRDRHQSQLAFRRAFDVAPPPVRLPQQAPSAWFRARAWLRWAPVPLLAAAMALVAVQFSTPPTARPTDTLTDTLTDQSLPQTDSTRLKGAADIVVLVQNAGVLDKG